MRKSVLFSLILMLLLGLSLSARSQALLDIYMESALAAVMAGDTVKAQSLFESAWQEARKLPDHDKRWMETLDESKKFYKERENFAKIDELLQEVMKTRQKSLQSNPRYLGYITTELANNAGRQGQLEKAEAYYTLMLESDDQHLLGKKTFKTDTLNALADIKEKLNKPAEAEALRSQVAKLEEKEKCQDLEQLDFKPFLASMEKTIKANWHPPQGVESTRTVVNFMVQADGRIAKIRVKESGGTPYKDAALQALEASSPLKGLPTLRCLDEVEVQYIFDYTLHVRGKPLPRRPDKGRQQD